jgi:hypothetical protein
MAMADTEERPSLEERYLAATNTSNLTVATDRANGAADVILAAGLVRNQLGHALIHLRGEWDRCDKPAKWTPAQIAKRAAELPDKKGKPDVRRANVEALVWHARAMRDRASRLTGRSQVLGLLTEWALLHGVEADLLSPALFHWLSPACPVCEGRGKMKIPDTPSLSNKSCNHCNGSATWPRPLGAERIHDHMRKCLGRAKSQMSHALYGQ